MNKLQSGKKLQKKALSKVNKYIMVYFYYT